MKASVRIHRRGGRGWQCPFSRRELVVLLEAMRGACGLEAVPLELTLADDAFISRVNALRLGCRGPTNILSFPASAGPCETVAAPAGARNEALLLFSLDTLERECLLYGQDPAEHTLRLLAHGVAHLSGLDHGPEMDALQDAVFTAGMRVRETV